MLPTLRAGEPTTSTFSMRVPTIDDPTRLRAEGTGSISVELIGTQPIRTVGGRVDAIVVRELFKTDLNVSKSTRETRRWYAPDGGLLLERWEETVRVLGIVVERSARTIRRLQ